MFVYIRKVQLDRVRPASYSFMFESLIIIFASFTVQSAKVTRKKPRFGALPILNMPQRSHKLLTPTPRPARTIMRDLDAHINTSCYETFSEFCKRDTCLKSLNEWTSKMFPDKAVFKNKIEPYLPPEFEVIVDDSLVFTVKVLGCYLVEDHPLYLRFRRTLRNVTLSVLVKELNDCTFCKGVHASEITIKLYHHFIPIDSSKEDEGGQQFPQKGSWRSHGCSFLICDIDDSVSTACSKYQTSANNSIKAKHNRRHLHMSKNLYPKQTLKE